MPEDLLECEQCSARFDVDQAFIDEPEAADNATHCGFLAGSCPECGAKLPLTVDQLRGFLTRKRAPSQD